MRFKMFRFAEFRVYRVYIGVSWAIAGTPHLHKKRYYNFTTLFGISTKFH